MPRRPAMTAFRRRLRFNQAQWREANGHPIGSQPHVPRPGGAQPRLVGSRLPLAYAKETGANLLTAGALHAARTRTSTIEPHQSFDHQRLWADLLSSEAVAFNLFGDLAADFALADQASTPGGRMRPAPSATSASHTRLVVWIPRTSTVSGRSTPRSYSTSATGRRGSSPSTSSTTSAPSRRPRSRPTYGAISRSPIVQPSSTRRRPTWSRGRAISP